MKKAIAALLILVLIGGIGVMGFNAVTGKSIFGSSAPKPFTASQACDKLAAFAEKKLGGQAAVYYTKCVQVRMSKSSTPGLVGDTTGKSTLYAAIVGLQVASGGTQCGQFIFRLPIGADEPKVLAASPAPSNYCPPL